MRRINKLFGLLIALFTCVTTVSATKYDPTIENKELDDNSYTIVEIQDYADELLMSLVLSNEDGDSRSTYNNNYEYNYSAKTNNMNFKSNGSIYYIKFFKGNDIATISQPVLTLAGNNTIEKLHVASKIKVEGSGSLRINKAIETVLMKDKDGKQLYVPYLKGNICVAGECSEEYMPLGNISDELLEPEFWNKAEDMTEEEIEKYASEVYVTEDYDINALEKPAANMEKMMNLLFKMLAGIGDSLGGETVDISFKFAELTKENIKLEEAYEAKEHDVTDEWINTYVETTLPVTLNADGSATIGEAKDIAITDFTVDEEPIEVDINGKEEIEVEITPNNATENLTWTSSDEKIAIVNNRGVVKGVSNGKAVITVSNAAGKKVNIDVTVYIPMRMTKIDPIADQVYTGKEIKPAVKVTYNDQELVLGTDYNVSYEDNVKVGYGTVYIEGMGKYNGYEFETFKIVSNTTLKVKQSARTSSSVTLKWNKPKAKTTGYQVYMATSANGKYKKVATISKSSTTSYKKTKLSAGRKYYFKVRNYYKSGKKTTYGTWAEVSATTAPATPSIKLASNTSAVLVKWNKVSGATGYEIYQSTDKKNYTKVGTTTSTSYKVENLNSATTYYYKVRAYKTIDGVNVNGSCSKVVSTTTKPVTPVVNNTKLSYNYATIAWDKVSRVSGYEVYRSTNGKKYTKIKTLKTNSYKNTGLNVGTTYYYKVRAYKTVSGKKVYSKYSKVVTVKPYLKATTVTGTDNYYEYARINFTKVSGATGYKVYRADSADGKYAYIGKTTKLYYNDTKAKVGVTYYYKVKAYRNINKKAKNGLVSNEASATRLGYKIDFKVLASTYNSNKVEITKDENATKYYIYRATSKKGKYTKVATLNASDFEGNVIYTDTKLTFNKTYYYKVRLGYKNATGYSNYKSVKTKLSTPVITSELTDNKVVVKFAKVAGASGYEVYRSTDKENYKKVKTITTNSYTDSNVEVGKTYYYKVRAYKTVKKVKYYSSLSLELEVINENKAV